ncbi:hypothetical protein [Microbulbifer zhoushanensis]|nr:hypothetical protein [Microbulbifer zhoushanensis]
MTILSKLTGTGIRTQSQETECNYEDNYYGDQVCVLRPHNA